MDDFFSSQFLGALAGPPTPDEEEEFLFRRAEQMGLLDPPAASLAGKTVAAVPQGGLTESEETALDAKAVSISSTPFRWLAPTDDAAEKVLQCQRGYRGHRAPSAAVVAPAVTSGSRLRSGSTSSSDSSMSDSSSEEESMASGSTSGDSSSEYEEMRRVRARRRRGRRTVSRATSSTAETPQSQAPEAGVATGGAASSGTALSTVTDPDWRKASDIYEKETDPETKERTKALRRDPHFVCLEDGGSVRLSRGIKDGKLRLVFKMSEVASSSHSSGSKLCKVGVTTRTEDPVGNTCLMEAHSGNVREGGRTHSGTVGGVASRERQFGVDDRVELTLDMADGKQNGTLRIKTPTGSECVILSDVPNGKRYYPVIVAQTECMCELLEVEHTQPVLSAGEKLERRMAMMRKRFEDVAGKKFLAQLRARSSIKPVTHAALDEVAGVAEAAAKWDPDNKYGTVRLESDDSKAILGRASAVLSVAGISRGKITYKAKATNSGGGTPVFCLGFA